MARELIYTSAQRGLKPGTRGFCTVAHTRGMKPSLIRLLESLSAYKSQTTGNYDTNTEQQPPAISHHRTFIAGESFSILSRVGHSGRDFTNRQNKLAYHLVLDPAERPQAGPAWLAGQPHLLRDHWDKPPQIIPEPRPIPDGKLTKTFASNWETLTGDAGWAGVVVRELNRNPSGIIYLIYEPGMDILPLIEDVTAILPPPKRWTLSFNTLFTHLPAGVNCTLRCCPPTAASLKDVRTTAGAFKLDLSRGLGDAPENVYVKIARGEQVTLPQKTNRRQTPKASAGQKTKKGGDDFVLLKNRTRKKLRMKHDDPRRKPGK